MHIEEGLKFRFDDVVEEFVAEFTGNLSTNAADSKIIILFARACPGSLHYITRDSSTTLSTNMGFRTRLDIDSLVDRKRYDIFYHRCEMEGTFVNVFKNTRDRKYE